MPAHAPSTSRPAGAAPRRLGRFELRRLLGKSAATMAWLAFDPLAGREAMLTLPRVQPATPAALARWLEEARLAARLDHPNLAPACEVGVQDGWPCVACERALGVTLGEWLAGRRLPPPLETVGWLCQALQGLAFAHEAGKAHGDLQWHHVLVDESGHVRLAGLATAAAPEPLAPGEAAALERDRDRVRTHRLAAERDVLAAGLLLHRLLAGAPPLDEPDTALASARMAPAGRELVRLPWSIPHPVPEALRAIANRATANLERQRYLGARTLLNALDGWRTAEAADTGGPLALLMDRMHAIGHLPAMPGVGGRVARLTAQEGQRTDEIAEQILEDLALSVELLRQVNSAQVHGTQIAGTAPVLTVRRAVALLGLAGIRQAAASLRLWPGPLGPDAAEAMQRTLERTRRAGHVARSLCPAGYDPEVVFVVTLLQNLGRLLVQYHFPEEARQVWQLMQPVPPPADAHPGTPAQPGLGEAAAACAVLGVDLEAIGAAAARHWGLGTEVQHLLHRLPRERAVRVPEGDLDVLRTAASAANEAVDVETLGPPARVAQGLASVAHRYARALGLTPPLLQDALQSAGTAWRGSAAAPPVDPPTAQAPARTGAP